jgi:hypothetical protein
MHAIEFAFPDGHMYPEFLPVVAAGLCVRDFAIAVHRHLQLPAAVRVVVESPEPPHAPLPGMHWLPPGSAVQIRRSEPTAGVPTVAPQPAEGADPAEGIAEDASEGLVAAPGPGDDQREAPRHHAAVFCTAVGGAAAWRIVARRGDGPGPAMVEVDPTCRFPVLGAAAQAATEVTSDMLPLLHTLRDQGAQGRMMWGTAQAPMFRFLKRCCTRQSGTPGVYGVPDWLPEWDKAFKYHRRFGL